VTIIDPGSEDPGLRAHASDHLLFLAPDVVRPSSDALDAMLELSQQEDIGAVGPIVVRPDGTIDSAGLVLGPDGPRGAFAGEPHWTLGHLSNILDVRNCAAVSGACLMTRRSVFEQVGGLDAEAGSLWDVDYCLRVRAAGLRVAVTPHARVRRNAAGTDVAVSAKVMDRDPYYNPNFDQRTATFRLPSC
jgi:GT2 family glycosyltransferase